MNWYTKKPNLNLFDHTDAGTVYHYSQLLNGGNNGQVGLAKTLSVMPGDTIKAEVYAKYMNMTSNTSGLSSFATTLTGAFGLSSTGTGEAAEAFSALNNYGALIAGGYNHSDDASAPKAYLNILLFDKDHNFVNAAYKQIGINDVQNGIDVKAPHGYLNRETIVTEPGYGLKVIADFISCFFRIGCFETNLSNEVGFESCRIEHRSFFVDLLYYFFDKTLIHGVSATVTNVDFVDTLKLCDRCCRKMAPVNARYVLLGINVLSVEYSHPLVKLRLFIKPENKNMVRGMSVLQGV